MASGRRGRHLATQMTQARYFRRAFHTLSRLLAAVLLLFALVAFVYDSHLNSWSITGIKVTSFRDRWNDIHPDSLSSLQALVRLYIRSDLVVDIFDWLLRKPSWLVLLAIGLVFWFFSRLNRQRSAFPNSVAENAETPWSQINSNPPQYPELKAALSEIGRAHV